MAPSEGNCVDPGEEERGRMGEKMEMKMWRCRGLTMSLVSVGLSVY